jgi:hypothetical protein
LIAEYQLSNDSLTLDFAWLLSLYNFSNKLWLRLRKHISSAKLNTIVIECFKTKELKTKRNSKSKMKTTISSSCVSRKSLYLKPKIQ